MILGFTIVLTLSCQGPQFQNDNACTLPNGETISAEDKAKLDALKPEVDKILTEVLGDSVEPNGTRKINSLEQVSILNERVTKLLKENFGDDYNKFITEKETSPSSTIITQKQSASSGQILESNPIQKSVTGANSTAIGHESDQYSSIWYYLKVTVNTTQTVWYSYNYAIQNIFRKVTTSFKDSYGGFHSFTTTKEYPVSYQTISIVDNGITEEAFISDASGWYVTGYLTPVGMPTASSVITYHYVEDPKVFNGSVWYSFQWGN